MNSYSVPKTPPDGAEEASKAKYKYVKKIYIKRSVFKLLIKNNHKIILMDIATEIG